MTTSSHPLLEIDRLSIAFGPSQVVTEVSLSIGPGEKVGLVGESGSGKSVTALSVLRLLEYATYQGAIRFEGRDLLKESERAMRGVRGKDIAMIFQEPMTALNALYTVGNQIGEVLELHEALRPNAARARAIDLLKKTGIPEPERRVDMYPHQLSGGQRQRAMIAMALACRPKLLIADEPTTALDVTVQAQILALLDELQKEFGMAILFITHDLNLVRRFTHRVGVMEKGLLVESGATEAVFAAPQHPYTQRLIASRPRREVAEIAGDAKTVIAAKGISVEFKKTSGWFGGEMFQAVRLANVELRRGETVGIVGESGSGKTTLGMALLALQSISAGEIRLEGEIVDSSRRKSLGNLRRRMQVVFQDPFASLNPRMTIEQILDEGLAFHAPELSKAKRLERILATLDEVGMSEERVGSEVLSRYPHEFSGGQRQRIAIARAIIIRPEILVLDEPTSALDVSVQQQVLGLLSSLQKRYGMSYIFISHDLAVMRAMAHRILVMKDGVIVEEEETERLFAAPREAYTQLLLSATL